MHEAEFASVVLNEGIDDDGHHQEVDSCRDGSDWCHIVSCNDVMSIPFVP